MNKPTPEDIEAAQTEVARAYLQAVLELLFLSGQEELNFVKKSIEMPNGGTYLLQLQHVTGPKLNIKNLFEQGSV